MKTMIFKIYYKITSAKKKKIGEADMPNINSC